MKKKLAIFDFDGTLVDAYDSIYKTINFVSEKLNYKKFGYEEVKRAVGKGDIQLIKTLFKDKYKIAHSLYKENYLNFLKNNVKVIDGVFDFLEELKRRKIKIAGATNRAEFSLKDLLKETDLEKYFDLVLCADDVKQPKPNPEIILKIVDYFRVEKKEVFYVGDMDIDYETGKNAEVDTYIVTTGSSSKSDFEKYDSVLIFNEINKVKEFLIENNLI
jgi:HAD superfamily hydrolase (TIGR01509 family)